MLAFEPEKRATAQEMLNHPWLNEVPNPNFKMSEREYEKMSMVRKGRTDKKNPNLKDIVESDREQNMADNEDNEETAIENEEDSDFSYLEPTEVVNIQNFNNSFAIYGQHVKLSALDKANPQFTK